MDDISLDFIRAELRMMRANADADREKLDELESKVRNIQDWNEERQCLLSLVNPYSDSGDALADWN